VNSNSKQLHFENNLYSASKVKHLKGSKNTI